MCRRAGCGSGSSPGRRCRAAGAPIWRRSAEQEAVDVIAELEVRVVEAGDLRAEGASSPAACRSARRAARSRRRRWLRRRWPAGRGTAACGRPARPGAGGLAGLAGLRLRLLRLLHRLVGEHGGLLAHRLRVRLGGAGGSGFGGSGSGSGGCSGSGCGFSACGRLGGPDAARRAPGRGRSPPARRSSAAAAG